MSAAWLKLIGTTEDPCQEVYDEAYADFAKRPRQVTVGDRMILYAVGGRKCVFADAQVTSEIYRSGRRRWPYRVNLRYSINLPDRLRCAHRQGQYAAAGPAEVSKAGFLR